MRTLFVLFLIAVIFSETPDALGQGARDSAGGTPSQEQIIQNNLKMLASVRSNPQSKAQALSRLKERLASRGITDSEARLAEIGKIFDEAISMSDADFQKNQQQLVSRVLAQLKGGASELATGVIKASPVPWIDVHDHLIGDKGDYAGSVKEALRVMEQTGATMMIVLPTPNDGSHPAGDCDKFISAIRQYPKQFAFLGGGSTLNSMLHKAAKQPNVSAAQRKQFEQAANEILRAGASGFGEMAIHHLSLHGAEHPYELVAGDHPFLLSLADIAAKNNVPIDIHLDLVTEDIPLPTWLSNCTNNPKTLRANLEGFERLLEHNPKTKIVWAHAGSDNVGHWTVDLSRKMLKKHPNLYMSLRLGPGQVPQNFPLTQDRQLRAEWLQLFKDFPDRFVIGDDQFLLPSSIQSGPVYNSFGKKSPLCRELTGVFLAALPQELARKIASENAISIYKLNSKEPAATSAK